MSVKPESISCRGKIENFILDMFCIQDPISVDYLLNVVCQAGECQTSDDQDQNQQTEFSGTLAQGKDDRLQTSRMSETKIVISDKNFKCF